jgi:hypothetical protein
MIMPGIGEDDAKGFRSSHAAIYNTFNNHATMREIASSSVKTPARRATRRSDSAEARSACYGRCRNDYCSCNVEMYSISASIRPRAKSS